MSEKLEPSEWDMVAGLAAAMATMAQVNGEHADMNPNHVLEAQILGLLTYMEEMRRPDVSRAKAHEELLKRIKERMEEAEASGAFSDDVRAKATHTERGNA